MRLLVVQESDWLERGPHQQHHLMERLSVRGHEVRVIDFEINWRKSPKAGFYSKRRYFSGVSKTYKGSCVDVFRPGILRLPLLDYVSIVFTHATEIRRQIEEFKPDVMIGFGILATFIAVRMAKRCKIPFVYYLIDALHTLIPLRNFKFLGKVFESDTLRHSNVVCVINERLKDYAIEMGAHPGKVHVVRAGIDTERFNPNFDRCLVREKLGIGGDDVVLFFMGWLYPFSGLKEVAIELAKIKDEYPKFKLLIVGEGDLYHELRRVKKDYDLEQLVLAGWQPYEKIPEFIAASDVCLLPAYNNEIMRNIVPIKMYEYLACGRPVIATKLPGIMKEFGEGNGVVYVDKSAEVVKKAIELRDDGDAIKKWGARAGDFVNRYSWNKITDEFENILQTTVSLC